MRRLRFATIVCFAIACIAGFVTIHPASAQFYNAFDPAGTAVSFINNNDWLGKAQGWARQIYLGLIIFEVIALGITTLLFRDNLGEFFASLCLKLVMGSVFFWFISVAGPGLGQLPGEVVTQTFGNTFGKGLGGTDDVSGIVSQGLLASAAYFGSSYAMRASDGASAIATEIFTPVPPIPPLYPPNCVTAYADDPITSGGGACYQEPSRTVSFARQAAENVTSGLGLMIGMAMLAIYLQFAMLTIETYFVMTAGTLFLGFAATRFTSSFSQGYFTYMISVGTKLMTFYIVLGLIAPMVLGILANAIATFAVSFALPIIFPGEAAYFYTAVLPLALFGALSVIVCAGLVYAAPGLAASFLTGQSSVSGSALMSQTMRSFTGGAQMMAQFASASRAHKQIAEDEKKLNANGSASNVSASPGQGQMSPTHDPHRDSMASHGGKSGNAAAAQSNQQSNSVLNDTLGMQRNDQALRDDIKSEKAQGDMSLAYGISAAASAAPQETAQPAAVQIRVGTPDRL